MRRILLILIVIILLAGIGLAAWWFLSVRSATPGTSGTIGTLPSTGGTVSGTNSTGTEEGQNGASPTLGTAQGALTQLTHNPILAYAPLANGTVRVLESTGQVSLITNNNEAVVESATSIDHPANVFLSHDGTKIVVSFGKPSARQTSVFNASTKKWSALPSGILSIVPSPTDARVAYTTESGGRTTIFTLDLGTANQKPKEILSLAALDLLLDWPTAGSLMISERPSAVNASSIWNISLSTQAITPILTDEGGLTARWNASGTLGFVFSSGNRIRGGTSRLVSSAGETVRALSFTSLPSKCDFDSLLVSVAPQNAKSAPTFRKEQALYCAIPSDQQSMSVATLPDAYLERALFTNDVLYAVSLVDGSAVQLLAPAHPLDADELRVASHTLYFINRYDQLLYSLSLSN